MRCLWRTRVGLGVWQLPGWRCARHRRVRRLRVASGSPRKPGRL